MAAGWPAGHGLSGEPALPPHPPGRAQQEERFALWMGPGWGESRWRPGGRGQVSVSLLQPCPRGLTLPPGNPALALTQHQPRAGAPALLPLVCAFLLGGGSGLAPRHTGRALSSSRVQSRGRRDPLAFLAESPGRRCLPAETTRTPRPGPGSSFLPMGAPNPGASWGAAHPSLLFSPHPPAPPPPPPFPLLSLKMTPCLGHLVPCRHPHEPSG